MDKRIIYKPYPDRLLSKRVQEPDLHQIKFGFEGLVLYFPQYLFQHSLPKKKKILSYANIYFTFLTECPDEPRTRKLLIEFSPIN